MFQHDQRNPTITVLLSGGTNSNSLYRTHLLSREFIVPSSYGKWARYVRTDSVERVREDGVLGTYRVYRFVGEVRR